MYYFLKYIKNEISNIIIITNIKKIKIINVNIYGYNCLYIIIINGFTNLVLIASFISSLFISAIMTSKILLVNILANSGVLHLLLI